MGYIAPITNFTAMNYQARQIGDGMSPYYIEKPFKIVLKELSDKEERHGEEADRFNEKEERKK